ncbi:MAG TPA: HEPN domain-containing protein [Candidatus Dojkabacteria bacterium]|jgi:HEPN domain-containing protein/predicted nucleotidyltransferase
MYKLTKLTDPSLGKNRANVWLRQALYDLEIAQISLDNGFSEWASYQAEQAVEKSLKAVIVDAGYVSPRTHKLSLLIGMCNSLNNQFKNTKFEFRFLDTFTLITRYPFLIPGRHQTPHELIKKSDADKLISQANEFVDKIKMILNKEEVATTERSESYTENPLTIDERLEKVKNIIVKEFDPESIILYGSYARNLHQEKESTMDIMVIAKTDMDFISRMKKIREATKGCQPTVEAIIYTPDEYKYMREEEGEGYLESALKEGKEIYSK